MGAEDAAVTLSEAGEIGAEDGTVGAEGREEPKGKPEGLGERTELEAVTDDISMWILKAEKGPALTLVVILDRTLPSGS